MKSRSQWIRIGFLNTLEHGFTRVADALLSIVLLVVLAPEVFSKLALGQALIAPLLVLFVSPETVIYRDYAIWKEEGASILAARLRAFRLFSWGKAQFALAFCGGAAWLGLGAEGTVFEKFCALAWALSLVLAPQIAGPDREFLRLSLRLRELNYLTLYQKISLLAGSCVAVWLFGSSVAALAAASVFSALSSALAARVIVRRILIREGATAPYLSGRAGPSPVATIGHSLREFSFWQHISGVALNWVQTMDVFFLGVWNTPVRDLGLYASALKIANFSAAVPTALSNSFMLWVGQGRAPGSTRGDELKKVARYSGLLALGVTVQCAFLAAFAPWILDWLARGRWNPSEQAQMTEWLRWMLGGLVFFGSSLLIAFWLLIRTPARALLVRLYLPWLLFSLAVYAGAVSQWGVDGAARANVAVGAAYLVFNIVYAWRSVDRSAKVTRR